MLPRVITVVALWARGPDLAALGSPRAKVVPGRNEPEILCVVVEPNSRAVRDSVLRRSVVN